MANVNDKGVVDPHNIENRYKKWRQKAKQIDGLEKSISDVLIRFLDDMRDGKNLAKGTKRGSRSFSRILGYKTKLTTIFMHLKKRGIKSLKCSSRKEWKKYEDIITKLFVDMRDGKVGNIKKSSGDYAKNFTAFWRWWIRVNKKDGVDIPDITGDLDTSKEDNTFVYFDFDQCKEIMKKFDKDTALMLLFMFDSVIRCPKELMNVRRCDITEEKGYLWLKVRQESAKTYERRFKLLLCADELRIYLKNNQFNDTDFIFNFSPPILNKKLKKAAVDIYGDIMTLGGKKFSQISMYDFRHSGACYYRKGAYNTKIDALMYRGGWIDLRVLNYYTKKLGMKDTITEEDMLSIVDKNKLEKEIDELKVEIANSKGFAHKLNIAEMRLRLLYEMIKKDDLGLKLKENNKELVDKFLELGEEESKMSEK